MTKTDTFRDDILFSKFPIDTFRNGRCKVITKMKDNEKVKYWTDNVKILFIKQKGYFNG